MLRDRTVELEEATLPLTRKRTMMGQMSIGPTGVALGMGSNEDKLACVKRASTLKSLVLKQALQL
jgi:hypothetical protein